MLKDYLARGKRGIVSTALWNGKKVVVKEPNPDADVDTIKHEAEILQVVNKQGIGPLFIAMEGNALIMERVDGVEILDWIRAARKPIIKRVLLDIIKQCRTLDALSLNKMEMTHPHKHIIVENNRPIMIDFERARYTEHPKNLTQVCQWLTGKEMTALLTTKNIVIPRDAMLAHARSYKKDYTALAYRRIVETVQYA